MDAASDIDTRDIAIDTRVTDPVLLSVATAHEVGHVILFTKEHTTTGIMGGKTDHMSADDRALACRQIGICL